MGATGGPIFLNSLFHFLKVAVTLHLYHFIPASHQLLDARLLGERAS